MYLVIKTIKIKIIRKNSFLIFTFEYSTEYATEKKMLNSMNADEMK